MSLIDELISGHGATEHVVFDKASFKVSLLKVFGKREFVICACETKKNLTMNDTAELFACMTEFIKNNDESSPCYSFIDVSKTDAFTLQQLKYAAESFKAVKTFIQTRLVGSVIKVGEDQFNDGFLSMTFKKLYTPIRPICWHEAEGQGSAFVTEWEEKMNV